MDNQIYDADDLRYFGIFHDRAWRRNGWWRVPRFCQGDRSRCDGLYEDMGVSLTTVVGEVVTARSASLDFHGWDLLSM